MNKIIKFLALGGIVWLCSQYLDGITVDSYKYAIIAAVVLAIINTLIRPVLSVISLPITLITFGLFSLVLTAFMVEIMDYFVAGITVHSFWWALLLGVIVSAANSFIDKMLNKPKKIAQTKRKEYTDYEEVK